MAAHLLSILLPVRNGARYIRAAVRSIINQTLPAWELIVVDDGSTDQTAQIVRLLATRDPRIRLYSLPSEGLVKALNTGLDLAAGDWIARMDADDLAMPARMERQIDWIQRNDRVVACGTFVQEIDPQGWLMGTMALPETHGRIEQMLLAGIGGAICHPSTIFPKAALLQVGGYHEAAVYCEDLDLYLRLGEIGELANLPEVLLRYRRHPGTVNVSKRREMVKSVRKVIEIAASRRGCVLPPFALSEPGVEVRAQFHRECSVSAIMGGGRHTALKHAILEVAGKPCSVSSWRFLRYIVGRCFAPGGNQKKLFPGASC